uniref:Uncharacterized protein n=1 Tax=Magallana gigas TaxID=29159 RepID=K1RTB6_MAGGI
MGGILTVVKACAKTQFDYSNYAECKKINEVLGNHNLCRLEVSGYIYDPQEYYLDYASEEPSPLNTAAKFHLYSHFSWKFAECICDVDFVLTDLLYNLLTYDFSTEGLVIEFQPESKVAKTIDTGALPKILTSMLLKFREPNIELPEKMKIEVEIRGHACKFENIDV